eukprot:scaffold1501_cov70-Phaeocystis_antarctica.AAC.1
MTPETASVRSSYLRKIGSGSGLGSGLGLGSGVDLEEDGEEEDDGEAEVAAEGEVVVAHGAVRLADGREEHVQQAEHEGEEELVHGVR